MNTTQQILQASTVQGNLIKLPPGQLDRSLYLDVKKALEGIGGKWKGGKTKGFVFTLDPSELLAHIAGGECINLKQDFQFFPTPSPLAAQLVALADLSPAGLSILEPSAGQGAIVEAILAARPVKPNIFIVEKMPSNMLVLDRKYGQHTHVLITHPANDDFLNMSDVEQFDRIIANPPFKNNQDIDHILKMYNVLNEGGRLVSIASPHWKISSNKKEAGFRKFLKASAAGITDLEPGAFRESGTGIAPVIITIDK